MHTEVKKVIQFPGYADINKMTPTEATILKQNVEQLADYIASFIRSKLQR